MQANVPQSNIVPQRGIETRILEALLVTHTIPPPYGPAAERPVRDDPDLFRPVKVPKSNFAASSLCGDVETIYEFLHPPRSAADVPDLSIAAIPNGFRTDGPSLTSGVSESTES